MMHTWLFFLSFFLGAVRADERPQLEITLMGPGAEQARIAIPQPLGNHGEHEEFVTTMGRDLELSGWFDLLSPGAFLEPSGTGIEPGQFRFSDWRPTGAMILAKTRVDTRGDEIVAELWLYNVGSESQIGERLRFSRPLERTRVLAHDVADAIMEQVTGQESPFLTGFAMSANLSGNKEIYLMDFDGLGVRRLTRNGSINLQPAWSPDSSQLAFTSYRTGNPDLFVADFRENEFRRVSSREGINSGADWRPGSNEIALTLSPDGDSDIYLIDGTTGARIRQLTQRRGIDVSPAWSPDGRQLAFVSERSGGAQIYIMNADGSNVRRVTFEGHHNTDPAWSPDGQRIAYVSRDEGRFDVFTVRVDGNNVVRITQGEGNNEDPTWSPGGHYIAFSSTRTGAAHIWLSSADGRHQVQLTNGRGGYTNPSWSPTTIW